MPSKSTAAGRGREREESVEVERIAVTFKEGCALLSIDDDTARKHRLDRVWTEQGILWTIPGTNIKRVLVGALMDWAYSTREEQVQVQEEVSDLQYLRDRVPASTGSLQRDWGRARRPQQWP